jgi:hypothetical protein
MTGPGGDGYRRRGRHRRAFATVRLSARLAWGRPGQAPFWTRLSGRCGGGVAVHIDHLFVTRSSAPFPPRGLSARGRPRQGRLEAPLILADSFAAFVGHPAYNTGTLCSYLHRFAFLLGETDGEELFGEPAP